LDEIAIAAQRTNGPRRALDALAVYVTTVVLLDSAQVNYTTVCCRIGGVEVRERVVQVM
jgi:hypothetical protein